ncbi:MAG TPA: hypothetical protein DEA08_11945 [Planctomycetes bacterium]|nr:hypothetical protein [Planctomycetota bacterium]
MKGAPNTSTLLLSLGIGLLISWGLVRVRPRYQELQRARTSSSELARRPRASEEEVARLRRQLADERRAKGPAPKPLPPGELSRLAAKAGLAVDVSDPWEPPQQRPGRSRSSEPRSLPARLAEHERERVLIRWSARGDFLGLVRFLDFLGETERACVLELSLSAPESGAGPLHMNMVLAP